MFKVGRGGTRKGREPGVKSKKSTSSEEPMLPSGKH